MIALLLICLADLDKAVNLSRSHSHEASEAIMEKLKENNVTYRFYRMINAYKLNDKEGVLKWADSIIYAFSDEEVPIRYHDMAIILKADVELWQDGLGDISREMTRVTDRLKNGYGGKQTQKMQKDILDRLGKMIKDEEDKRDAAAKAAQDKEAGSKKEGSTPSAGVSETPASDVVQGGESGTGGIDPKRVKEIADVWGKLPEKERASALRELTRKMPPKDRAVIEAYFRELAKRSGK